MHTSSRFVHDGALPMRGRPGECFQGLAKREVALAIALSLLWIIFMFSLGLDLPPQDLARVVCQPEALAIGAFDQMSVVPLAAFVLAKFFGRRGATP